MINDAKTIKRCQDVIRAMMGKGPMTLAEITSNLSMSLPVVTEVVNKLCEEEKTTEIKNVETLSAGRPPAKYQLNASAGYTIGVELGRIYTNFVVLDYTQTKVFEYHKETLLTKNVNQVIKQLDIYVNYILNEVGITKDKLLGIGISIPGIVKGEEGISETYLKLNNITLKDAIEQHLNVKVRMEHDVKSMTLGELYYGAAKEVDNSLYINYGWGLGLGIIVDNKVFYGNNGYAGEFGHIPLVPNGELCYCGKNGCLETKSSGRAITKAVQEKLSSGASSMILKSIDDPSDIDPIDILNAANKGDLFSIEILEEAGKYLGIGIGVLINLFNPNNIIIGGTISQVASYLMDSLKNNAMKHSLVQLNEGVNFQISSLRNNAGSLGVARLTSIEHCCDYLIRSK